MKIAIVSLPGNDLDKVRSALRNPMKFTVREFLSMQSCTDELASFPMEILILRVSHFDEKQIAMICKVQRRFPAAAVVVLAKEVNPVARLKAATFPRFKLLQDPLEVSDLASIIEKLRKNDPSLHRLHPRARRHDAVQVIDSKGISHRGHFIDFAQMGAKLSVPSLEKFGRQESVQIVYDSSSDPGKLHRIQAKVIWSTFGIGLVDQFMGVKQQFAGVRFIAAY